MSREAHISECPELLGEIWPASNSSVLVWVLTASSIGPPPHSECPLWAGWLFALEPIAPTKVLLSLTEGSWPSLQASRGGCFLCFADEAPILCSESMCSKDKPQENSCCLLTLTIRTIGKWRKQEMTNGFSDQEEMVAENCCWVTVHSYSPSCEG